MTRFALIGTVLTMLALAGPARAQERAQGSDIPEGHKPPPGMCRIWIDGVPAGRQPAPTDCPTAIKRRPSNGRVIFGDQAQQTRNDDSSRRSQRRAKQQQPDSRVVKKLHDDKRTP
jgi:hypothetical protein